MSKELLFSALYPSDWLMGFFLALAISFITLHILWRVYRKRYSFTTQEKWTTYLLSVVFMMAGSVMIDSFIPIVAWGFYAFHFSVDRKYMELPNGVNGAIALSAISTLYIQNHSVGLMESGLVTAVILFVVFLLFALLGPMGGGDIKMMAATGLFFVVWDIPSLLFFGFLIGTIQGVALMMIHKQKKDTLFAFGPALILGILMVVFIKGGGVIV